MVLPETLIFLGRTYSTLKLLKVGLGCPSTERATRYTLKPQNTNLSHQTVCMLDLPAPICERMVG